MYLKYNPEDQTLTGQFLKCDASTLSGRTYPFEEVQRANDEYQSFIRRQIAIGTVGFPIVNSSEEIDPNKAAILVLETHFKGKILYGTFKILKTPAGQLLTSLLNIKAKFKAAMSATGVVTHGTVSNLKIISFNLIRHETNNPK